MISAPVMDHLTRLAMVYSVIEQIRQSPNTYTVCRETVDALQEAHNACKIALLEHCGIPYSMEEARRDSDGIKADLGDENARMSRHETRLVQWIKSSMEVTVKGTEWITTVMEQSRIQHNTLPPKFSKMRELWDEMHELLFRLYQAFDPELEDEEAMGNGLKLSSRMT